MLSLIGIQMPHRKNNQWNKEDAYVLPHEKNKLIRHLRNCVLFSQLLHAHDNWWHRQEYNYGFKNVIDYKEHRISFCQNLFEKIINTWDWIVLWFMVWCLRETLQ